MIFPFAAWLGQGGYILAAAAIAVFFIVALWRPRIERGRRSTEFVVGKLFRVFLSDEAQASDAEQKSRP